MTDQTKRVGAVFRVFGRPGTAVCILLLAALATGCRHSGKGDNGVGAMVAIPAPQPPLFFTGPMALLLTNVDGFRAHVVLEAGLSLQGPQGTEGELLGQGGKLVFAPTKGDSKDKGAHAGLAAFIWDVASSQGYVLNGPLQGYAPISSSQQFTNVTGGAASAPATVETVSGHPCQTGEVTVSGNDGSATIFRVWRATDLKGLPLRISGTAAGTALTLTLSKVQLESVPDDLFAPPSGFTRYPSSEAMVNELFTRRQNLKHRPAYIPDANEPDYNRDYRLPSRVQ